MEFALILARQMGRTLQELGETMSAQEFGWHYEQWQRSPWGPERTADLPAAIVASTMANLWRGRDSKAVTVEDFQPYAKAERRRREQLSAARASENIDAFVKAANARISGS